MYSDMLRFTKLKATEVVLFVITIKYDTSFFFSFSMSNHSF